MMVDFLLTIYFVGSVIFMLLMQLSNPNLCYHGKTANTNNDSHYVSKRCFIHFYLIGVCCNLWIYQNKRSRITIVFIVHILRRFIECLLRPYSIDSKMHILHYLAGITFYPIAGYAISKNHHNDQIGSIWLLIFFNLSIVQMRAHRELHALRTSSKMYQRIPKQGMFRFLLCPHYLSEILLYLTFAYPYCNFPSVLVLMFVFTNLSISGYNTRQWHSKFDPEDHRPAFISYIF